MGTPVSGSTPYCSVDDFLKRKDLRTVGDLLATDDHRYTLAEITDANGQPYAKLLNFLKEGSGWLESETLLGGRYTVTDLTALTGNSQEMIRGLVADLAMFRLWTVRPERLRKMEMPVESEMAFQWLERLSKGQAIFGIQENIDAANPTPEFLTPEQIQRRNSVSNQARRFFGSRAQYHVPGG